MRDVLGDIADSKAAKTSSNSRNTNQLDELYLSRTNPGIAELPRILVFKTKLPESFSSKLTAVQRHTIPNSPSGIGIGLLTGCQDRPYASELAMALASRAVQVDVIGSDEVDSPELHVTPNVRFVNFRGSENNRFSFTKKLWKLLVYYARLMRYVARPKPRVLHILWNNKFEAFDRTLLMLYYRVLGKKIAFTAHNINQARRDRKDSWWNRVTLKMQYNLCDHIFVHTQKMKGELCGDFGVSESAVTVLRHPVNNAFPDTELTAGQAKRQLGLKDREKAV